MFRRTLDGDPFGFLIYGNSLATNLVRSYFVILTILVGIQFCFDTWIWGGFWRELLGAVSVYYLLGGIFSTPIAALDWSIIIQYIRKGDLRNNFRIIATRFVAMVAALVVTSVFLELRIFHSEVNIFLDDQEKVAADDIRRKAIAEETGKFHTRLTAAGTKNAETTKDVVGDRKTERTELLKKQEDDRLELTSRIAKGEIAEQKAAERHENDSAEIFGISTRASATLSAIRDQLKANKAGLVSLDTKHHRELAEFDTETERLRRSSIDKGDEGSGEVQKAFDAKIIVIREMSPADLARAYPGNWVVSRGIMAKWAALKNVVNRDENNTAMVWIIRIVLGLLPFIILIVKFNLPDEVAKYFDPYEQAAAGHVGAQNSLKEGLYKEFNQRCRVLKAAVIEYRLIFAQACQPDAKTGLCPTKAVLTFHGLSLWMKMVHPHIVKLDEITSVLKRVRVNVPEWPAEGDVQDPRLGVQNLGEQNEDELTQKYGWADPTVKQGELDRVFAAAQDDMNTLKQLLSGMEVRLLMDGEEDLKTILLSRKKLYLDLLHAIIQRLETAETYLSGFGMDIPSWPTGCETHASRRQLWNLPKKDSYRGDR